MRNLSPKNTLLAIFLVAGILVLYSCIVPVGQLDKFLEDDKVQTLIGSVIVGEGSDAGLTGRNKRIEGLNTGKYYMVSQELDDKGDIVHNDPDYPLYVYTGSLGDGVLKPLGSITSGNERINNLTNDHTYTVNSATPPTGGTLAYYDDGVLQSLITVPADGIVNIPSLEGACSLNLSGVGTGNYTAVPVPDNRTTYALAQPVSATPVPQNAGTTVDYVFSDGTSTGFKVLRVTVRATVQPGTLTVNITLANLSDQAAGTITPTPYTANISLGNLDGTSFVVLQLDTGFSNIIWRINGTQHVPANGLSSFTLSNSAAFVEYLVAGEKIEVTVEAIKGGERWGAEVEINVN